MTASKRSVTSTMSRSAREVRSVLSARNDQANAEASFKTHISQLGYGEIGIDLLGLLRQLGILATP